MRYAVIIEKGPESYGAYVPDLPASAASPRRAASATCCRAEPPPSVAEFVNVAA